MLIVCAQQQWVLEISAETEIINTRSLTARSGDRIPHRIDRTAQSEFAKHGADVKLAAVGFVCVHSELFVVTRKLF